MLEEKERLEQMVEFEVAGLRTHVLKPRDCYRWENDESKWIFSKTEQLFQLWLAGGAYMRSKLQPFNTGKPENGPQSDATASAL
uniref:Uncharacterized protein n=1 Tax=Pseudomonas phage Nican01 TaxID=3138540 RepID=A0AAU6W219_9CAUD